MQPARDTHLERNETDSLQLAMWNAQASGEHYISGAGGMHPQRLGQAIDQCRQEHGHRSGPVAVRPGSPGFQFWREGMKSTRLKARPRLALIFVTIPVELHCRFPHDWEKVSG